jgi:CRP-like cAMP-binding protein
MRLSVLPAVVADAFPLATSETRHHLIEGASFQAVEPGATIVRQGEDGALLLVLNGYIAHRRTTVDGRQVILRVTRPGQLGPILALASRPIGADAVAISRAEVARWPATAIRALGRADAGFAMDLNAQAMESYEAVLERLDGLLYQSALRRVARVLLRHADLFFEDQVLTRAYLPTMVGTSREMTGRVLRALEAQGIVARTGRDRLSLLNPSRLELLATGAEQVPRQGPLGDARLARTEPAAAAAAELGGEKGGIDGTAEQSRTD